MKGDKKIRVKLFYGMVVNNNLPNELKFTTILHELAHLYCGHLGTPYPNSWSDRRSLDKNQREFEAESVCWLICEMMGIKNPSAEYLSGYLNNNKEIHNISIDAVLKAVNLIEPMVNEGKNIRKWAVIE